MLSAGPDAGSSELLLQAYDRIFNGETGAVPIYFSFDASERVFEKAALRFVRELVTQAVAYSRRERGILLTAPEIDELGKIAELGDSRWIDQVLENVGRLGESVDRDAVARVCFGAPVRAALAGIKLFVMIDNAHNSRSCGAGDMLPGIAKMLRRAGVSFVISGRRRFFEGDLGCERFSLERLSDADAGEVVENTFQRYGVEINDSTRDLLVHQFAGHLQFAESAARRAKQENRAMTSFRNAASVYTAELFGGTIGKYFDDTIASAAKNSPTSARAMDLIYQSYAVAEPLPLGTWKNKMGIKESAFEHFVGVLNDAEVINASAGRIEPSREDITFGDFIEIRHRLEFGNESRTLIFAESLADFVNRAPAIMGDFYRSNAAIGLREMLRGFEGQSVPSILFDYSRFKAAASGLSAQEVSALLLVETDAVTLPNIIFSANTQELYPSLSSLVEVEHSAAAIGFLEGESGEELETVWLAAEIESKFEIDARTTEIWCKRLEFAAEECNFAKFQLWLVANEGFSQEAMEIITARGGYSSSRKQADLLKKLMASRAPTPQEEFTEYEFVLPMTDDAELIAAHTIEEISRSHNIDLKSINQIKTALIEACINASEHGKSPDGKLHQHIKVSGGKIELTVSNRGIRISDRGKTEIEPTEGRRGWGLNLMRKLMDEVRILRVDDGTSIQMVKRFST